MRKLKIAVYYNLPSGGARTAIEHIVRGLRERGYELDVYTGELFKFFRLKFLDNFLLPINLWRYKIFSRKIAKKINKKNYHLAIISNSIILQHPYILRYLKVPKLLISQEPLRMAYEKELFRELVYKKYYQGVLQKLLFLYSFFGIFFRKEDDRKNLKKADKVIVNSYFSKENFLANYGILGKVVYPGIDADILKPRGEKKSQYILSVGSYHSQKGHDLAIKALKCIPANKRPHLKILGFGHYRSSQKEFRYLKNLTKELEIEDKVEFQNDFKNEEIVKYYQNAYLTLCPNFLEPFGLVPIESMACEVPVVAVREGGFRETILDGKTGFLAERDPKEMAKKIEYLLDNDEEREKMGKAGREWVKKAFSWGKTINEIERAIYNLILNSENRN